MLSQLLQRNAAFDHSYRFYDLDLYNHLPMALVALHELGADAERLSDYYDDYALKLSPFHDDGRELDDWQERLGQHEFYPAYRRHYRERVALFGVDETLEIDLPRLMPGCGAAAFHGPIRLAYALRGGDHDDIADALASFAAAYFPLPPARPGGRRFDALGRLAKLYAEPTLHPALPEGTITARMRHIAALPSFAELAVELPAGTRLQDLAEAAAQLYWITPDFTLLHLITGCHAVRQLGERVPFDPMPWLWPAFVAAYLTTKAIVPERPAYVPSGADWPELCRRALRVEDEHVIKLVHVCREEEAHYGDCLYRAIATRAAGLA